MYELLKDTKRLMRAADLNISQACREIGVTSRWWHMFLDGSIPDPRFSTLEKVHRYLSAKEKKKSRKS